LIPPGRKLAHQERLVLVLTQIAHSDPADVLKELVVRDATVLRLQGLMFGEALRSPCFATLELTNSEPEDRTKREPQVVVRAAVKVDFVAHFEAQSHRTQACLHSCSRIHGCV